MREINDLREIIEMSADEPVYVRWSLGPDLDADMGGRSFDYANGAEHCGLSANRITGDMTIKLAARVLKEYRFLRIKNDKIYCWICRANLVGRDSDNAYSIEPTEILGRVSDDLIEQIARWHRDYDDEYRAMQRRPLADRDYKTLPRLEDYLD